MTTTATLAAANQSEGPRLPGIDHITHRAEAWWTLWPCGRYDAVERAATGTFRLMFGGVLDADFAQRVVDTVLRGYTV